jgi:hypothetical protein
MENLCIEMINVEREYFYNNSAIIRNINSFDLAVQLTENIYEISKSLEGVSNLKVI